MTVLAAIVMAAALLEHHDFFALGLRDDFGRNHDTLDVLGFTAVTGQQNVAQRNGLTGFTSQLFDRDFVSGGNSVLLAARAHYSEHGALIRSFHLTARPIGQRPGPRLTAGDQKSGCP